MIDPKVREIIRGTASAVATALDASPSALLDAAAFIEEHSDEDVAGEMAAALRELAGQPA